MKLFKKKIGLYCKNQLNRHKKIQLVSLSYDEIFTSFFIHFTDGTIKQIEHETHEQALHDFLILIKNVKVNKNV